MIKELDAGSEVPVTRVCVPCEAPAFYRTGRGSAPIHRGPFSVRFQDGRTA